MQLRTKRGLKTLRQAHAFLAARAYTAAMGELKPQVDTLAAIVQRLDATATDQKTSHSTARAATDAKRALSHLLRMEYMRPISRIARRLFEDDTDVRKVFTDTPPRDDEGLMQAASSFAALAGQYRERFVEKGLAPDFVERLEKTLGDFREVLVTRALERARRASATVALREELARGRDQVRIVDAMLAPRLASRPEQLAEWRSIARFAREGGADEATEVPATGGVPAVPGVPGGSTAAAPAEGSHGVSNGTVAAQAA